MAETISIEKIYNKLKRIEKEMITKKEIGLLIDTMGIMNNPQTMKQIAVSVEDIKHGRVTEV